MGESRACVLRGLRVWCWGRNEGYGLLGKGETNDNVGGTASNAGGADGWLVSPSGTDIIQISLGFEHTCFITSANDLFCFGRNDMGQLGVGHTNDLFEPADIGVNLPVVPIGKVEQVSAGEHATCAILTGRTSLVCFGRNSNGELGTGDFVNYGTDTHPANNGVVNLGLSVGETIIDISVGFEVTCVLIEESGGATVRGQCWGDNEFAVVKSDVSYVGDVDLFNTPQPALDFGTGFVPADIEVWKSLACVISRTNELKCWGRNYQGVLGFAYGTDTKNPMNGDSTIILDTTVRDVSFRWYDPVAHSVAYVKDPDTVCFFGGTWAQATGACYANDRFVGASESATISLLQFQHVKSGAVCGLRDDGSVKCRGASGDIYYIGWNTAQTGSGDALPVLPLPAVTLESTCEPCPAESYCTGGTAAPVGCVPPCAAGEYETSICNASGVDRSCASCPAGDFWCDGVVSISCTTECPAGTYEDAGCTPSADRVCVQCPEGYYCENGEWTLCPTTSPLSPAGSNSSSDCHGCETPGMLEKLDGVCVGVDVHTTSRAMELLNTLGLYLTRTGSLVGFGSGSYVPTGGSGGTYAIPGAVTQFSIGWDTVYALNDNGDVYCFGGNNVGNCGTGDTNVVSAASPVQVPIPITGKRILKLVSGNAGACVLYEDTEIFCWGRNNWLTSTYGTGSTSDNVGDAPGEMAAHTGVYLTGLDGGSPIDIEMQHYEVMVLFDDSSIRGWGYAGLGNLGDGIDHTSPVVTAFRIPKPGRRLVFATRSTHKCVEYDTTPTTWGCWGAFVYGTDYASFAWDTNHGLALQDEPVPAGAVRLVHGSASEDMCFLMDDGDVFCKGSFTGASYASVKLTFTGAGLTGDLHAVAYYRSNSRCALGDNGVTCISGFGDVYPTFDAENACVEGSSCNIPAVECPVFSTDNGDDTCTCWDGYADVHAPGADEWDQKCAECHSEQVCVNGEVVDPLCPRGYRCGGPNGNEICGSAFWCTGGAQYACPAPLGSGPGSWVESNCTVSAAGELIVENVSSVPYPTSGVPRNMGATAMTGGHGIQHIGVDMKLYTGGYTGNTARFDGTPTTPVSFPEDISVACQGQGAAYALSVSGKVYGTATSSADLGTGWEILMAVTGVGLTCTRGAACVLDADLRRVECWGLNTKGPLAPSMGTPVTNTLSPTDNLMTFGVDVVDMGFCDETFFVLLSDSTLYTQGESIHNLMTPGVAGGTHQTATLTLPKPGVRLFTASNGICVQYDDDTYSCWGALFETVFSGSQPTGVNAIPVNTFPFALTTISSGWRATAMCMALTDDTVRCVGSGGGLSGSSTSTFTQISFGHTSTPLYITLSDIVSAVWESAGMWHARGSNQHNAVDHFHAMSQPLKLPSAPLATSHCAPGEVFAYMDDSETETHCVSCPVGYYCVDDQIFPCGGNLSTYCDTSGLDEGIPCTVCSSLGTPHFSVGECTARTDTVCQACSTCLDGFFTIGNCTEYEDVECTLCPENHWCSGGMMYMCISHSTSAGNSSSIADCVCDPGYYLNGGACEECPIDHWCPGGDVINACPVDSNAPNLASEMPGACVCDPGYEESEFFVGIGPVCVECPVGEYCLGGGNATACPDPHNMLTLLGSDNVSDCYCRAGTYQSAPPLAIPVCTICPANYYCLEGQSPAACPANSIVSPGANHSDACTCMAGYKSDGMGGCEICSANHWCLGEVENPCPAGDISPEGSSSLSNCTCADGTVSMDNTAAIFVGEGNSACFHHGLNLRCWGTDQDPELVQDFVFTNPVSHVSYMDKSVVVVDTQGQILTFDVDSGATVDAKIRTGEIPYNVGDATFSAVRAVGGKDAFCVTGVDQRVFCTDGNGMVSDYFPAGYSLLDVTVIGTSGGFCYCALFSAPQYGVKCWGCDNSQGITSPTAPSGTTYNRPDEAPMQFFATGFFPNELVRDTMGLQNWMGAFDTVNGGAQMWGTTSCSHGWASGNPLFGFVGTQVLDGDNTPMMNAGTGFNIARVILGRTTAGAISTDGVFKMWGAYQYWSSMYATFNLADASGGGCSQSNSVLGDVPDDFEQLPTYDFGRAVLHANCDDYTRSCFALLDDYSVRTWGYGKPNSIGASTGLDADFSITGKTAAQIPVVPLPLPTGKSCLDCPLDSYCIAGVEYACPSGMLTTITGATALGDCRCPAGQNETGPETCEPCPSGFYCPLGVAIVCPVGHWCDSTTAHPCTTSCSLGEYWGNTTCTATEDIVCNPCPAQHYCSGTEADAQLCDTICPLGSIPDMECGAVHPGNCTGCPADSWCSGGVENSCPQFSVSPGGSDAIEDCICIAGYHRVGNICEECPIDHWCPFGDVMHACPGNSSADHRASEMPGACICDPGFEETAFNSSIGPTCTVCVAGEYCRGGNASVCPYPHDQRTPPGADNVTDCYCRAGLVLSGGGVEAGCDPCPVGSYCPPGGEFVFTCPSNTLSPAGSNHSEACVCVPGYHGPAGGPCSPCEAGSWCYGGIQNPCPLHHSSDPMAGGIGDCRCVDGYGSDGGGNCVVCGDTEYQSFSNTSTGDACLPCPPNRAQDGTGASCDCAVGWDVSVPELSWASGCDVCAFSYSDDGGGGCAFCSDTWVCVNGTVEDCEYCGVNEEESDACTHVSHPVCRSCDNSTECCSGVSGEAAVAHTPGQYCEFDTGVAAVCSSNFTCPGSGYRCPLGYDCIECDAAAIPDNMRMWEYGRCYCNDNWAYNATSGYCDHCRVPGAQVTGESCAPCADGYVCDSVLQTFEACDVCPVGQEVDVPCTQTSQTVCKICDDGFYGTAPEVCSTCPAGSWCTAGVETTCNASFAIGSVSSEGSSSDADCSCPLGEYRDMGPPARCLTCPAGSYCPDSDTVVTCPVGTDSVPGSSNKTTDCVCLNEADGYSLNSELNVCECTADVGYLCNGCGPDEVCLGVAPGDQVHSRRHGMWDNVLPEPRGSCNSILSFPGYTTCYVSRATEKLWCWGQNTFGEAGVGTTSALQSTPFDVVLPSGKTPFMVRVGYRTTTVQFTDGTLKCFGVNSNQQCGYGHTINPYDSTDTPELTQGGLATVLGTLGMGWDHACAVVLDMTDTKVQCWGFDGQNAVSGTGGETSYVHDFAPHTVRVLVVNKETNYAILSNNELVSWGRSLNSNQIGTFDGRYYRCMPDAEVETIEILHDTTQCLRFTNTSYSCWGQFADGLSPAGASAVATGVSFPRVQFAGDSREIRFFSNGYGSIASFSSLVLFVSWFTVDDELLWMRTDQPGTLYSSTAAVPPNVSNPVIDYWYGQSLVVAIRENGDWVALASDTTIVPGAATIGNDPIQLPCMPPLISEPTCDCQPCIETCSSGLNLEGSCSRYENAECVACAVGSWCQNGTETPCTTACGAGRYMVSACDAENDMVCTDCPVGSWCAMNTLYACPMHSFVNATQADEVADCVCNAGYVGAAGGPCTECPIDHWCPGGVNESHACPLHSFALSGSDDPADCVCGPGYEMTSMDAMTGPVCEACPDDHFCAGGAKTGCPDDNMRAPAQSDSVSDCYCREGYWESVEDSVCEACPVGTFCPGAVDPMPCPNHTWSPIGSNNSLSCVCENEWYGPAGGPCILCPVDSWCYWDETPNACPVNTWAPAGSQSLGACTCDAGYRWNNNTSVCELCPDGSFRDDRSRDDETVYHHCTACPNSVSLSDRLGCECMEGWMQSNPAVEAKDGGCDVCNETAGYYMPNGTFTCVLCPVGHYCADGVAHSCGTCPVGQYVMTECTAQSPHVCSSCPSGTDQTCFDGLEVRQCTVCAADEYESSACMAGADRVCEACPMASYCNGSDIVTACTVCLGSEYETAACTSVSDRECMACPAESWCNGSSTVTPCVTCDATEYETAACTTTTPRECEACPVESWCDGSTTVTPCTACSASEYEVTACLMDTDRTCLPCPAGSWCDGSDTVTSCTTSCAMDHYITSECVSDADTVCTACPPGMWCNGTHAHGCTTECPFGAPIATPCTSTMDAVCTPCAPGEWCDEEGAHSCTENCGAGQHITGNCTFETDTECSACPSDLSWFEIKLPEVNTSAPAEFAETVALWPFVMSAEPRAYGGVGFMAVNVSVPWGANTSGDTVVYYQESIASFAGGPSAAPGGAEIVAAGGVWCDGEDVYGCTAYCGDSGFIEEACTAGSDATCGSCIPFNGAQWCDGIEQHECTANCGDAAYIAEACDSNSDVVCESCAPFDGSNWCNGVMKLPCSTSCGSSGYIMEPCDEDSDVGCGTCLPFDGMHWCDGVGRNNCTTMCEASEYISVPCTAESDVVCTSCEPFDGLHWCDGHDQHECREDCESGTYETVDCDAVTNRECATCPADSWCFRGVEYKCPPYSSTHGLNGSISVSNCSCDAGYVRDSDACLRCTADHWCPGDAVSGGGSHACPGNTSSLPGSDSVSDCVCSVGYHPAPGANSWECIACAPGALCPGGQFVECPDPNMHAEPGSTNVSTCACVAGFHLVDGACVECVSGEYCPGDESVQQCPGGAVSPPGSHSLDDCYCDGGTYRQDPEDHTSPCGICPVGYWCNAAVQHDCPAHTISSAGSSAVGDCRCLPGYGYSTETQSCVECADGFYKIGADNGECMACPDVHMMTFKTASDRWQDCLCQAGYVEEIPGICRDCGVGFWCEGQYAPERACHESETTETATAVSEDDCICLPGYYRTGAVCTMCEPGFWCADEVRHECTGVTGILAPGATELSECLQGCLPGTYRPVGDSTCVDCTAGHWCAGGYDAPVMCTEGVTCEDHFYLHDCNASVDAHCVACMYPENATVVLGGEACGFTCHDGFFRDGDTCSVCSEYECELGTRAVACTALADFHCVDCPTLAAHAVYVEDENEECVWSCEEGYWRNDDELVCCSNGAFKQLSGVCSCLPGWVGDGVECVL